MAKQRMLERLDKTVQADVANLLADGWKEIRRRELRRVMGRTQENKDATMYARLSGMYSNCDLIHVMGFGWLKRGRRKPYNPNARERRQSAAR